MGTPVDKGLEFIENKTFDEIRVGDGASLQRTLTPRDIQLFAVMSGDVNPAHVDPEYAKKSLFHEVIAHGMWGGAHLWPNYRAYFECRGYSCVTPTLRHHDVDPESPPPAGLATTSLLDYAEDLERQIRSLDALPVLMGHSMGGILAQILAARGLCTKAVLLTPAAPRGIVALRPSVMQPLESMVLKAHECATAPIWSELNAHEGLCAAPIALGPGVCNPKRWQPFDDRADQES